MVGNAVVLPHVPDREREQLGDAKPGMDPDDKQAAIPHPICSPETLFHLCHFQLTNPRHPRLTSYWLIFVSK